MFKRLLFLAVIIALVVATHTAHAGPEKNGEPSAGKIELFNDSLVHEIRIQFQQCNWWDSLVANKKYQIETEHARYLQGDVTIDGNTKYAVGIRIKGESSYEFYPTQKKSFKISFDHYDKGQRYQGLRRINLNNSFKDPTFMREKLYLDALRSMGCAAQQTSYANVYINNELWGVYLVLDNIDKDFQKRNFDDKKGALFKGEPQPYFKNMGTDRVDYVGTFLNKSKDSGAEWSALIDLIQAVNAPMSAQWYYDLNSKLDMTSTFKQWGLNNAFFNVDAYNLYYPHNFYLYRPIKDERFHWISYDGNYSFGAWSPVFTLAQMIEHDPLYTKPETVEHLLTRKLLVENDLSKKAYLDIYKSSVLPALDSARLFPEIDRLAELLRDHVSKDPKNMYKLKDFNRNIDKHIGDVNDPGAFIPGLKPFILDRRKFLSKNLPDNAKQ